MVKAGFRKRTITVPVEPEAAARLLMKHFGRDALRVIWRVLGQCLS
jgi:hypothetical protein